MKNVEHVGFNQVYDLVFRAKNARLASIAYVLDYYDWMKAGVAFNTRGLELSTRKISYFAKLYDIISRISDGSSDILKTERPVLEQSLSYYYADIFEIYQDHVRAKHSEAVQRNSTVQVEAKKILPEFGNLLVLPAFDCVPQLRNVFRTVTYPWDGYKCRNTEKFDEVVASTYVKEGTSLYSCMSMMFDYGICSVETGVLLEVSLWDNVT